MAEEKKTPAKKQEAPKKPEQKETKAVYPQKEAETITVRAADGTQLYDPVTRTLYKDDKEGTKARAFDQFVVTNLKRGKLKEVK